MKFVLFTVLAYLLAMAYSQSITIGTPADGDVLTPGTNITIQVLRPDSLTASQEVSIVISLLACTGSRCTDPASQLGTTLYSGGFDPQFPANRTPTDQPQQNITVAVPATLTSGPVQLAITHLALVGAGPYIMLEIKNLTLAVAQ
ncbi:hypothetical protein FA95DRAFT_303740 [Auriscalpium vulgare]|uniref:Uncharacterized protein n=1 Tax=Auriscalpium vulgare TaxID=40419 RepID=A0ACB8RJH9_9AGAM|nr:hypothetical protein FA95DRAFT_303740 [Auriscalpium vulgare]